MTLNTLKIPMFFLIGLASWQGFAAGQSDKSQRAKGIYFEETFFPVYVKKNDFESQAGGSTTQDVPTQTGWGIDTRTTLGYVWHSVLLGATYNHYRVSSSRPSTADSEGLNELTERQETGISLGGYLGRWRFVYTYFLSATKIFTQKYTDQTTGAVTTDETRKNTDGTGFQAAVGYDFIMGAGIGISPTLIYRTVTYGKQTYTVRTGTGSAYPSSDFRTKAVDSELRPMITLNVVF
ncbi:MAG: hypothetical protein AB7F86_15105 [Bdellovibrionales bacterium]